MKNFLTILSFFTLITTNAHAVKLYLLSNHDNAGDHNQVLGVKRALAQLSLGDIPTEDLNTKTTSSSQIKDIIERDLTDQKVIVVGSGEGGVIGIKDLPLNPNLTMCLLSHMFLES